MAATLLRSKSRVPGRRAGAVARPRLTHRLTAAARGPLTVLAAPAGFGKTTALTEWLATLPAGAPRVAWLSLDRGDDDAALFWTYVVTAIRSAVGDVEGAGAAALQLLAASSASIGAAIAVLLNELGELPGDVLLVLDDYHLVEAPAVHETMAFLLDHQPPQLHVVIATRTDPPLPLARMRAQGRLSELRAADLRFTVDESAAYLNDLVGLGLTEGDVAALDRRTEGWIAALQLAGLSLQDRDDAAGFIEGFAGDDRFVVDYLGEEVLARQPADIRTFLLRTSVLERFTGPLCDAVTAREGGRATLIALERAGLFLVPLDDRREWYRYHHLFGDVLRAHLLDEHPEAVPELHLRASTWFAADGDHAQAVDHALAAGDPGRAAELMELAAPAMTRDRRDAELARWVRALPDTVVRERPVLGVWFAGALARVSDFATVGQRLSDVERRLRAEDGTWPAVPPPGVVIADHDEYASLPARIAMYRAALALAQGDLAGTIGHAREASSVAPAGDDLARASSSALAGLASWTTGDLDGAHAAYTATVAGLGRAGFVSDVLACSIALGDIRCAQGRLGEALTTYRTALDLAAAQPGTAPLRGTADMHVAAAGVLLERDDLPAAADHLELGRRLGADNGLPQNAYRSRLAAARLREAEGDLDAALELVEAADRVYVADYFPPVRPVPAVGARLRLRRGELDEAEAWARELRLTLGDELSYLREYEHVTLARLLLARHRDGRSAPAVADALRLLERLLAAAETAGRGGTVLEVLILQALAHQALGTTDAALAALRRAVELAGPEGHVRLFAEEGAPMAALLKVLLRPPGAPATARRLLAATTRGSRTTRTAPPGARATTLVEPLSSRELDVLRLLGTDLDGPEIARALSVSLNTMRTHTKSIYAKLGVTSRRAAVRQAEALDLLAGRRRG